jgi:hypothetical protein
MRHITLTVQAAFYDADAPDAERVMERLIDCLVSRCHAEIAEALEHAQTEYSMLPDPTTPDEGGRWQRETRLIMGIAGGRAVERV